MRWLILFLALVAGSPASSAEFVFSAPTIDAFVAGAAALGYYDVTAQTIVAAGPVSSRGGDFFFNFVGAIPNAPGVWARLRHNGDETTLPGGSVAAVLATAAAVGVTVYQWSDPLGCWTSDAATCAPSWVADVGPIM